ncbi:lactate utilization protein [Desulfovibrio sp. OttesenSCG-928-O18]|nr:lactate utilization protein [Desulfovibrio sp. OttesenSCG-928-O18]
MDTLNTWHYEALGKRAVQALEKNGFTAAYFADRASAAAHIFGLIPAEATIGIGGSQSERALGIAERLKDGKRVIHDHNRPGLSKEEIIRARYGQLTSDVFICGTNALTLRGELVNTDATGNRVAAMIFGPKRVIVIAGANKIVRNVAEAEARIKMTAAPMNNKRFGVANPCVELGECVDCRNATRLCKITTIISRCPTLTDFHVVVVGEALGY